MKTYSFFSRTLIIQVACVGLTWSGLGGAMAQDGAIARVGSEDISVERVRAYLENLAPADRNALEKNPALLNQAVRTLILQQILFKEAMAADWDKQPEVVAQLERVRQNAIAESYLDTVAKAPDDYPSDTELLATYEARKAQMVIPKQVQLAQIYVAAQAGGKDAAARRRIDAIEQKVRQGDFAPVARAESDEKESAAKGGEVGWVQEANLQPEIRQQVSGLKKSETSKPIQLEDGWYIVKVLDVKEARTAALDEVREQLKRAMRVERTRQNREAYLAKLQQQNPMAVNELALATLLKPEKQ